MWYLLFILLKNINIEDGIMVGKDKLDGQTTPRVDESIYSMNKDDKND